MAGNGILLWAASLAYACLWTGVIARRHRQTAHVRWMLSGLAIDVTIVVSLELSRHAVGTAVSGDMSPALLVHVWASTAAILCYLGAATLGTTVLRRGHPGLLGHWHRRVGWTAMTARSLGFVTMLVASDVSVKLALMLAAVPAASAAAAWSHYRDGGLRFFLPIELVRQEASDKRQP